MIDAYEEFIKYFKITKRDFFSYGMEATIYPDETKVKGSWENLKKRIVHNEQVSIRSYGRNARNSHIYLEFIDQLTGNKEIKIDSTNNAAPQRIISELTGLKRKKDVLNYQVSHIFGMTRNPYMFECPWNIVLIPKIFDPFTGHESNGEWAAEYQKLFHEDVKKRYKSYIDDYNEIMDKYKIETQIEDFLNENTEFLNVSKTVRKDLHNDFRLI